MTLRNKSDAPDLNTQLESLLDQVWRSEYDWRLWDRLDAASRMDSRPEERRDEDDDDGRAA